MYLSSTQEEANPACKLLLTYISSKYLLGPIESSQYCELTRSTAISHYVLIVTLYQMRNALDMYQDILMYINV